MRILFSGVAAAIALSTISIAPNNVHAGPVGFSAVKNGTMRIATPTVDTGSLLYKLCLINQAPSDRMGRGTVPGFATSRSLCLLTLLPAL